MANSLLVSRGNVPGKKFLLTEGETTVGRDGSNTILLQDNEVSRHHCRIAIEDGQFILIDMGSSNGTFVNGNRITRSKLKSGDRIRIGGCDLVFQHDSDLPEPLDTSPDSTDNLPTAQLTSLYESDDLEETHSPSRLAGASTYYRLPAEEEEEASRRFVQVGNDLRFLYHASLATSRSENPERMLEEILALVFDWVAADRGCVFLKKLKGSAFDIQAFQCREGVPGDQDFRVIKPIVNFVRRERVGVLSSKASSDERWGSEASLRNQKIGEVMCVPIQGRDEILGLIYLDTVEDHTEPKFKRFNQDHLRLMIAMAHQAAVAIENEAYYRAIVEKERLAAIGETTAALAHHVKNTIQGINGGSHLIESGLKSKDLNAIQKGWQIVNRNQEQISRLVIDMLIIGRPYEPIRELSNLNEATEEAIRKLSFQFSHQNTTCRFQPNQDLPKFNFDYTGLSSAILHIINCCLIACQKNGEGAITVSIEADQNQAVITIEDNGEHIEVGEERSVFEPFGLGNEDKMYDVGLVVSRKILRAHDGDVRLSHLEQQGNQFLILVPLA